MVDRSLNSIVATDGRNSHLLTHTAGLAYESYSPLHTRYRKFCNEPLGLATTVQVFGGAPLLYEPGTMWMYSPSVDWAGKLIERVSHQSLEEYMKKNIWAPLGVSDISFWPDAKPSMKSRKAEMSVRNASGALAHDVGSQLYTSAQDCFGGHGAWASMQAYFEILQSIMRDDEILLKRESTKVMFEPQLSKESRDSMKKLWSIPAATQAFVGEFPHGIATDWGIGGMLLREATEGWRRKDTLVWSGMPNLCWVRLTSMIGFVSVADVLCSSLTMKRAYVACMEAR